MYKYLIELYRQQKVSFKYVKTFNMDEYIGEFELSSYMSIFGVFILMFWFS